MKHLQEKGGEHSNPIRVLGTLLYNHAVLLYSNQILHSDQSKGNGFYRVNHVYPHNNRSQRARCCRSLNAQLRCLTFICQVLQNSSSWWWYISTGRVSPMPCSGPFVGSLCWGCSYVVEHYDFSKLPFQLALGPKITQNLWADLGYVRYTKLQEWTAYTPNRRGRKPIELSNSNYIWWRNYKFWSSGLFISNIGQRAIPLTCHKQEWK